MGAIILAYLYLIWKRIRTLFLGDKLRGTKDIYCMLKSLPKIISIRIKPYIKKYNKIPFSRRAPFK